MSINVRRPKIDVNSITCHHIRHRYSACKIHRHGSVPLQSSTTLNVSDNRKRKHFPHHSGLHPQMPAIGCVAAVLPSGLNPRAELRSDGWTMPTIPGSTFQHTYFIPTTKTWSSGTVGDPALRGSEIMRNEGRTSDYK